LAELEDAAAELVCSTVRLDTAAELTVSIQAAR
jgi:hypothetical protein